MKKILLVVKRLTKNEAGVALPMALILLLFAGFLVVPLLALLETSLMTNLMVEDNDLELYAADAGFEYAVWKLANDGDLILPGEGQPPMSLAFPEMLNDRTVDIEISCEGEQFYKVSSTATSDYGDSTEVEAFVTMDYDFSWLFGNAITSPGDVSISPGTYIDGPVHYNGELDLPPPNQYEIDGELKTDPIKFPSPGLLIAYYWQQVSELPPYPSGEINISSGTEVAPYSIESLYRDGNLTITGSGFARLDGTVYVTGDFKVMPGSTLDINGQTVFVEGNIDFQPGCTILGSGCIIAIGDVNFQPNIVSSEKIIGVDDLPVDLAAAHNTFVLSKFTAEVTGIVNDFEVKCFGAGNIKAAIYADNGGEPGALMNAVDDPQPVSDGWNDITFPATDLVAGTDYWLAANSDADIICINTQTSVNRYKTADYSTFTFPLDAGTGFTNQTTDQYLFAGYNLNFLFVMSVTGISTIQPNGSLYGSIAGACEVDLSPGFEIQLTPVPGEGVNFPDEAANIGAGGGYVGINTYKIK